MEAQVGGIVLREDRPMLISQYRTINRGGDSIFDMVRAAGFSP